MGAWWNNSSTRSSLHLSPIVVIACLSLSSDMLPVLFVVWRVGVCGIEALLLLYPLYALKCLWIWFNLVEVNASLPPKSTKSIFFYENYIFLHKPLQRSFRKISQIPSTHPNLPHPSTPTSIKLIKAGESIGDDVVRVSAIQLFPQHGEEHGEVQRAWRIPYHAVQ